MAVGTDHHAAGEGVVLQHHLVDDARTGFPEADAVLVADALQEVEHLVALVERLLQILLRSHTRLDQVVAVYGAGHGHFGAAGGAELEQGHLRGGVLHGHAVGCEIHIIGAALVGGLRLAVPQVGVQDLLGVGERLAHHFASDGHTLRIAAVHRFDHVQVEDGAHA